MPCTLNPNSQLASAIRWLALRLGLACLSCYPLPVIIMHEACCTMCAARNREPKTLAAAAAPHKTIGRICLHYLMSRCAPDRSWYQIFLITTFNASCNHPQHTLICAAEPATKGKAGCRQDGKPRDHGKAHKNFTHSAKHGGQCNAQGCTVRSLQSPASVLHTMAIGGLINKFVQA